MRGVHRDLHLKQSLILVRKIGVSKIWNVGAWNVFGGLFWRSSLHCPQLCRPASPMAPGDVAVWPTTPLGTLASTMKVLSKRLRV